MFNEVGRLPIPPRPLTRVVAVDGVVEKLAKPRINRHLDTAAGWLMELGSLYRQARRGQLLTSEACRLAYIAGAAAKLAQSMDELKAAEAIREQLTRLNHRPAASEVSVVDPP
jgi:hypothetical protein